MSDGSACTAARNGSHIITNGGGPGAMAADRAGDLGIPLAELTNETMAVLNKDGKIYTGGDNLYNEFVECKVSV